MQLRLLLLLGLGHLVIDLPQGALSFFLPFFKEQHHLSYTAVGLIVLVNNISSSIIQPLFGYWSDRINLRWLLVAGCLVAGVGFGLTGLSPSYAVLLPLILLSGLGVAAYHPEASKVARWASGHYRATSMAIFSVGGNLGMGLGPALATFLYARAGLAGTLGFAVPDLIMFVVFWLLLPQITALTGKQAPDTPPPPVTAAAAAPGQETAAPEIRPVPTGNSTATRGNSRAPYGYVSVALLVIIVVLRSWVHAGLSTYIPLYYVSYLGGAPAHAGTFLTVFLISGAIGTLVGSPLADRWGLKTLIAFSMLAQIPLIYSFTHVHGPWLYAIVAASGFLVVSTFATTAVLAQELLPNNIGLASGLIYGFAIGTGGLGVTIMGAIADTWGVPVALSSLTFLPVLALILTAFLPRLANSR